MNKLEFLIVFTPFSFTKNEIETRIEMYSQSLWTLKKDTENIQRTYVSIYFYLNIFSLIIIHNPVELLFLIYKTIILHLIINLYVYRNKI